MRKAEALSALAGTWAGPHGVTYAVPENSWMCMKIDQKGEKKFRLGWDDEYASVLWGTNYWLDSADLATDLNVITWYRTTDYEKEQPAFTWDRLQPLRTTRRTANGRGDADADHGGLDHHMNGDAGGNAKATPTVGDEVNHRSDDASGNAKATPIARDEGNAPGEGGRKAPSARSRSMPPERFQPPRRPVELEPRKDALAGDVARNDTRPSGPPAERVERLPEMEAKEAVSGKWKGEFDETYTVDEVTLECTKNRYGDKRTFNLEWEAETGTVLWGTSYYCDPSELTSDPRRLNWYRGTDFEKKQSVFSWTRPEGFDLSQYLEMKRNGGKKGKKEPATEEEREDLRRKEEAEQRRIDMIRKKYEEELAAKRKATEEAKKKADDARRKAAEQAAEKAEETRKKDEQALLQKIEERKKLQEEIEKARIAAEERLRQEIEERKRMRKAALANALANTTRTLEFKCGGRRAKSLEPQRARALADTPNAEEAREVARKAGELFLAKPRPTKPRDPDGKPILNVVLLGESDSGKSRLFGNLLFVAGAWDKHALERFQVALRGEAADGSSRRGTQAPQRLVAAGRRVALVDPPRLQDDAAAGVAAVATSDAAIVVVSAKRGELEASTARGGGQLWEHLALLKAFGVERIVVAVSKMDDPDVAWSKERFEHVKARISAVVQSLGLPGAAYVPISNFTRSNLKDKHSDSPWFNGKTVLDGLGALAPPSRDTAGPMRFVVRGKVESGDSVQVSGRVVQGSLRPGEDYTVMPSGQHCSVEAVVLPSYDLTSAPAGEPVCLRLQDGAAEQLRPGEVICAGSPARCVVKCKVSLQVLEPAQDFVVTSGFKAVLHAHAATEDCEIVKVMEAIDLETKEKQPNPKALGPNTFAVCVIVLRRPIALAPFVESGDLGRFVIRRDSKTIALGKVTELPKAKG